MSYPKSRIGKRFLKKADLLKDLDPVLAEVETELDTLSDSVVLSIPTAAEVRTWSEVKANVLILESGKKFVWSVGANPALDTGLESSNVIALASQPGGAYVLTGDVLITPTLADLAVLPAVPGALARVTSLGCLFAAIPIATNTADGITVVDGNGTQWQRIIATSDQRFQSQTDWYIDAINGNDENPGTQALPVKSAYEVQRRWGSPAIIRTVVTITIVSSIDEVQLSATRYTTADRIVVKSLPTTLVDTTLSSVSPIDAATNHWLNLQAVGIADWTPYLEKRMRFAVNNAISWVGFVSPEGLGLNVARCSFVFRPDIAANFPAIYTPLVGDRVLIESLPTIKHLSIRLAGASYSPEPSVAPLVRSVTLDSVSVANVASIDVPPSTVYSILVFGSYIRRGSYIPTTGQSGSVHYACACRYDECQGCSFYGCVLFGIPGNNRIVLQGAGTAQINQLVNTFVQGMTLQIMARGYFSTAVGVFNSVSNGILVYDDAYLTVRNALIGRDNVGAGIVVRKNGMVCLDNSVVPKLTGTTGDIVCSNSLGTWAWTDVPFAFGEGIGVATLVAGTVTVTAKNMPADARITVGRNTPGGTLGELSAPQASRANLGTPTAQFVVNSANAADTSTVDYQWKSISMGSGRIIRDAV